ncbi:hypothetical protein BC938DRAFT_478826 [Jimgerdemannia flammicorona]|uniref:Uncharacterized protein n=1 Tax=Jimgerdemannia flammicorona TaxID=994334 RepID=A0A433QM76_9FUNG|nr:hypothetical protein BC938DRAFT_478826 [Jimgerdemannia flammicorona]
MGFPRLPPIVLAVVGSVLVYAGSALYKQLDKRRFLISDSEPRIPRLQRYQSAARASAVIAATGAVFGVGYFAYYARTHRPTPATISASNVSREVFHDDQYADQERRYKIEMVKSQYEQIEREEMRRRRLEEEGEKMQRILETNTAEVEET